MFDQRHYVPVLKGRAGELGALREADERVRGSMTPLIEIPPVPWDFESEQPAKEPREHVGAFSRALGRALTGERRFFLDGNLLSDQDLIGGRHPLAVALDSARSDDLRAVPVTGRARGEAYDRAVSEAIAADNRGACLRMDADDLQEPDDLEEMLTTVLARLDLTARDVDLVLDLGAVSADQRWTAATVRLLLGSLPNAEEWRSLTVVSSSFPLDLSGVEADSAVLLPRAEWTTWESLRQRRDRMPRMPTYGDYGISHPVQREVDPRIIQMSAAIRYTTDREFLIIKGRSVRLKGFEQYFRLAEQLVSRSEFHGEGFSWGDGFIARTARRADGPGNAARWRQVGTSQHLAFVVAQLEGLPDD
jgi:hypothetical protein